MRVLGIETSCDETAAAVVEDGWALRSNVIASQADLHAPFGGVVPELASRRHVELITAVIQEALEQAGLTLAAVDGIAVTNRPGLIGALMVGVAAAQALSLARGLPLVGVHHIEGHVLSSLVDSPHLVEEALPAVALVASGGHTELYHVRGLHAYAVMGRRRDDAAGEAFDKGARVLGLGSGGGAALDRAAEGGDPKAMHFPRARTEPQLDFSFSGLKTALIRYVRETTAPAPLMDLAASYQAAIVDALVERATLAVERAGVQSLLVGGGVAANRSLQAALREAGERRGFAVYLPERSLCTDNAAMIAAVGHSLLSRGAGGGLDLDTLARAPLTDEAYA